MYLCYGNNKEFEFYSAHVIYFNTTENGILLMKCISNTNTMALSINILAAS
jgi:hypothetical protein